MAAGRQNGELDIFHRRSSLAFSSCLCGANAALPVRVWLRHASVLATISRLLNRPGGAGLTVNKEFDKVQHLCLLLQWQYLHELCHLFWYVHRHASSSVREAVLICGAGLRRLSPPYPRRTERPAAMQYRGKRMGISSPLLPLAIPMYLSVLAQPQPGAVRRSCSLRWRAPEQWTAQHGLAPPVLVAIEDQNLPSLTHPLQRRQRALWSCEDEIPLS